MTVTQVSNEISDALDCSPKEKLRCINRLVYADEQPAIYVTDYLAPLVEEADLPWGIFKGNMVQFLGASLEPSLHQIRSYIRAGVITPEISSYMKLPAGTPVLSVRSTIYNVDNRPVNFSRIYFNSSIVELSTVRMIRST
jgi:DNA-binding GntR family transcriptional regulator